MLNKKRVTVGICLLVLVLVISVVVLAGDEVVDENLVRRNVSHLTGGDPDLKENALNQLRSLGEAAIPVYVKIMEENISRSNFINYELVRYAEELDVAGLPMIELGLKSADENARKRAIRAASNLKAEAASLVSILAGLGAEVTENDDIRTEAVNALRTINVLTPEVKRAVAISLCGDQMLAFRTMQVMNHFKITYDDVVSILLDELKTGVVTYQIFDGITEHLHKTSEPFDLVASGLHGLTETVQLQLLDVIDSVYSGFQDSRQLTQLLLDLFRTGSDPIKERVLLVLLANYEQNPSIVSEILILADNPDIDQESYQYILAALERTAPEHPGILPLFIKALADPNSTSKAKITAAFYLEKTEPNHPEVTSMFIETIIAKDNEPDLKLAAARYLEKCSEAAYLHIADLIESLDSLPEEVLWRLSPLFYHVAQVKPELLGKIEALTNAESDLIQLYGHSLLSALGAKEPSIEALQLVNADAKLEPTPAFPTAEGWGRYAQGGRGGDVYIVTSLDDSGSGTLREAVEAQGPRTVVFAVSGNIMLESTLNIRNPYITIAGQTAPGEGITIAGAPLYVRTDHVIIRYIRLRMGDYNRVEDDALGGRDISDVIIDHVSASWATDECVSFYRCENLTLQWSFITESLRASVHFKGNHGYGGIWGGTSSFHHNLLAHHSSRNPRFDGERTLDDPATDMRNNVVYNWVFNSAYGGEGGNQNMIANYFKPGPATRTDKVSYRIIEPSNGGKWYVADNYVYGNTQVTVDNWAGGVQPSLLRDTLENLRVDQPFSAAKVTTHTAEEAYELILTEAGTTLPIRDVIDQRIVTEVRTGTATYGGLATGLDSGIIDSQKDVGGLPFLRSYSAPLDSNSNGIPDWWSIKYGLNPQFLDHAGDLDGDGYTNLEEYLNNTNPLKAD